MARRTSQANWASQSPQQLPPSGRQADGTFRKDQNFGGRGFKFQGGIDFGEPLETAEEQKARFAKDDRAARIQWKNAYTRRRQALGLDPPYEPTVPWEIPEGANVITPGMNKGPEFGQSSMSWTSAEPPRDGADKARNANRQAAPVGWSAGEGQGRGAVMGILGGRK